MCSQVIGKFDECSDCGKEFKQITTSDPRKGYDVLQEDAEGWRISCKGCGTTLVVPK